MLSPCRGRTVGYVKGRPWATVGDAGGGRAERCVVISLLPIFAPKSDQTNGMNDPGRNLGVCEYPSARMNLLAFSDASVNNKFRRTPPSEGTLLG